LPSQSCAFTVASPLSSSAVTSPSCARIAAYISGVRHTLSLSRASVGVASSSSRTMSMRPSTAATHSAIMPFGSRWLLGAAHVDRSSPTTSPWPLRAAHSSGVLPATSVTFALAPSKNSVYIVS
jgi:hypothetical protein